MSDLTRYLVIWGTEGYCICYKEIHRCNDRNANIANLFSFCLLPGALLFDTKRPEIKIKDYFG